MKSLRLSIFNLNLYLHSQYIFWPAVFVLRIALTQVETLAPGLVELHEVSMYPPLKPVQVPLDSIPSLQ